MLQEGLKTENFTNTPEKNYNRRPTSGAIKNVSYVFLL